MNLYPKEVNSMANNMTKEQRQRMAYREFIGSDPEQQEITYTVQVSGGRVWIHRTWEEEWDNEHGSGRDTGHDCWVMSVPDLKKLIEQAQICIHQSEAFEAAHPLEARKDGVSPQECGENRESH